MVEEEKRKQKERAVRRRSGRVGRLLLGFWRRLVWLFLIGGCGGGVMSTIMKMIITTMVVHV